MLALPKLPEDPGAGAAFGENGLKPPAELLELTEEVGERFGIVAEAKAVAGEAASALLEACESEDEPVLVAVGNRGLGAVDRAVLGSVSSDVLRAARGPVLVVKSSPSQGDHET